jgi:hypothetical protein
MIARCYLFNGDVLDMLAQDEDDVRRIGREIAVLQAQQTLGASMIAQMNQMGKVLRNVLPPDDIEELLHDKQAANVLQDIVSAPEPATEYEYTKPDGLPGVLDPAGWASVLYVEAEEDEDE